VTVADGPGGAADGTGERNDRERRPGRPAFAARPTASSADARRVVATRIPLTTAASIVRRRRDGADGAHRLTRTQDSLPSLIDGFFLIIPSAVA
ncbi:MAG: hypothetical protein ABR970_07550, partial [Roseiarcus sp.]